MFVAYPTWSRDGRYFILTDSRLPRAVRPSFDRKLEGILPAGFQVPGAFETGAALPGCISAFVRDASIQKSMP
jgi:hypothetical protein